MGGVGVRGLENTCVYCDLESCLFVKERGVSIKTRLRTFLVGAATEIVTVAAAAALAAALAAVLAAIWAALPQ